jgi:FAD/FMN-containing dehydrogenase
MTTQSGDGVAAALEGFSGALIRPDDAGYDDARRLWNGLIDRRPAVIARCRDTADVVRAVNAAREHGVELSIRGGGHNVAGLALVDDGLTVDLSEMRGIDVDAPRRRARVGPGATWAEVNAATQEHGLAVTGGVISTTGIAGLTLGGGLGWLMGVHGLAADNLVSAEVVTADGRVLTATDDDHADLFWALRGGGGNFGVVTSFEYRLHPVGPTVTGGLLVHPFDVAGDLLRFFRDFTAELPDELSVFAGLIHAPDGSGTPLAGLVICHIGPPEQAERDLAPVRAWGTPALAQLGPMPYAAVNAMLDDAYPPGSLNYWRSSFMDGLSDAAIDTVVERFAACPSPMTAALFEHFHGAVTRIDPDATACPHRDPGYNFVVTSVWAEPATSEANVAWTRETFDAMRPFFADRRYLNYLAEDEAGDPQSRAVHGANHDRLRQVKRAYDPENLFRRNVNVAPAAAPAGAG